ncbi:hypothetical protein F5884DRAFT_835303 [Xylogone sp. PMI_703]|nr:hypothetical protein F5884DRAFT_835303 [Xylogone sp. PMI_703]
MGSTGGYSKFAISTPVPPQPKRIVICRDGTWQSATSLDPKKGCASNVARLSRVLATAGLDASDPTKTWQQIVYYDAGIGTGDIGWLQPLLQGGTGGGFNENLIEAYNFIVNNYAPGDKLYFFGFSRGAYTVRAVAGLVCRIGILKPSFMSAFLKCYSAYLIPTDDYPAPEKPVPFEECRAWRDFMQANAVVSYANCAVNDVDIEVIGVWDTVGSLGVPDMGHWWKYHKADLSIYDHYNTELHSQVRYAFQALALDEKRGPFAPSVWKLKSESSADGKRERTKLLQCWFPGAHVNIGGGSASNTGEKTTGDREQLASISYAWMLDRIRPFLALSEGALQAQLDDFKAMATFKPGTGDKNKGWSLWNATKELLAKGSAHVMPVGYALGDVDQSYTPMYQFMGSAEIRTPGQYHNPDKEFTTERIHPSVHYRRMYEEIELGKKGDDIYQPLAMKGWKRELEESGVGRNFQKRKGYKWILRDAKGNVVRSLWEFEIGHMPEKTSVEMRLIEVSWVKEIHEEVKKQWVTV